MILPIDAQMIIDESEDRERTAEVVAHTLGLMSVQAIVPTEIQVVVLTNHLNEMVKRARLSEKMMTIDPSMFSDVSSESLALATEVVQMIGNLPEDELYLLSIHFETAKYN
ncbi:PRD domain-containing protein [Brochothrix thermosphacta]|uniref:PRD domain-containing protein n=1 Tax=Brochothrix thermosphacta TaxID=2756 RepID=UPI000D794CCE|nr:PRD domain-containing protein [Brochothrix thermosphacta]SPN76509.1 putative PRD domain protein [Brochothrix thermosphacta]